MKGIRNKKYKKRKFEFVIQTDTWIYFLIPYLKFLISYFLPQPVTLFNYFYILSNSTQRQK